MNIIIFSKDRACQLDLFLRSFYKHVKFPDDYNIRILFTYSNDFFKKGYNKVFKNFHNKHIDFILEKNFKIDLLKLINKNNKHIVFFMDDNVFIRGFHFYDWAQDLVDERYDILCKSLRLNHYLEYCYPAKLEIKKKPKFDNFGIFEWEGLDPDYNYPMSLDGHVFRTNDLLPLLKKLKYNNPNSLEGNLALNPIDRPKMFCYEHSKIINLALNRVQTNNFNYCGDVDASFLNDMFLEKNKRLNIDDFNIMNKSCHIDKIDLIFE